MHTSVLQYDHFRYFRNVLDVDGRRRSVWAMFIVICFFGLGASCLAQTTTSYLYDWVPQPYSNKTPVEYGYVEQANGHLHLEIPIGDVQQNRSGSGTTQVRLVYDSNFWNPDSFGTASDTWDAGASWHLLPQQTTFGFMGNADNLLGWATDMNGVQHNFPCEAGCYSTEGHGVWIDSSDGSSAGVYGPDGSMINNFFLNSANLDTTTDANGNYLSIGTASPPSVFGEAGGLVNFNTSNTPFLYPYSKSIDLSSGSLYPLDEIYIVPNMNSAGGTETYTAQEVEIQLITSFNSPGAPVAQCGSVSDGSCTTQVLSSIVLPDQTSFTFKYDCDSTIAAQAAYCNSPGGQAT